MDLDITQHHMMDIRRAIAESNATKIEVAIYYGKNESAMSVHSHFSRFLLTH
jgi:hypothetical protein